MLSTQRDENKHFTFQDLLSWDEGKRYEIFDGEPILIAIPSTKHQGIITFLTTEFNIHLQG